MNAYISTEEAATCLRHALTGMVVASNSRAY